MQERFIQQGAHLRKGFFDALRLRLFPEPCAKLLLIAGIQFQFLAPVQRRSRDGELLLVAQRVRLPAVPFPDHLSQLPFLVGVQALSGVRVKEQGSASRRRENGRPSFVHAAQLAIVDGRKLGMILGYPVRQLEQTLHSAEVFAGNKPALFGVVQQSLHILGDAAPRDIAQAAHSRRDPFSPARVRGAKGGKRRFVRRGRGLDHVVLVEYSFSRKPRWESADLGQL